MRSRRPHGGSYWVSEEARRFRYDRATFTYDGNGNVSEPVSTTGSIPAHCEYDPVGTTSTTTETGALAAANPFRFSTKYWDGNIHACLSAKLLLAL